MKLKPGITNLRFSSKQVMSLEIILFWANCRFRNDRRFGRSHL